MLAFSPPPSLVLRGHSTQERRAARRELKNLAKTEAVSEEEQAKKLAEVELREQEELLHSQLNDTSQVAGNPEELRNAVCVGSSFMGTPFLFLPTRSVLQLDDFHTSCVSPATAVAAMVMAACQVPSSLSHVCTT